METESSNFHRHWKTHFIEESAEQDAAPVQCKICNKIESYDQVIEHYNKSPFALTRKNLQQSVEEKIGAAEVPLYDEHESTSYVSSHLEPTRWTFSQSQQFSIVHPNV